MFTATVETTIILGEEYMITTFFKDGIVVGNPNYQLISSLDIAKEYSLCQALKVVAEGKIAILSKKM